MRKITLIIVHCTANRAGSALRMADIDRYHRSLGWIGCGYHYVIPVDGTIEAGQPEAQKRALRSLLEDLHKRYPKALIVGHCDLEPRKPHCPGFKIQPLP